MNNNNKKKINWLKTVRPLALILVMVLLLGFSTYSWMKRDWNRSIEGENIKIAAGSSLTFIVDDDEGQDIDVADVYGIENFTFKSVSNCTGNKDHFFGLNFGSFGLGDDQFVKLSPSGTENETAYGKNNGYLVLNFTIALDTETDPDAAVVSKTILIDGSSYIRATETVGSGNEYNERAAKAVRISVTANGKTTVFANNNAIETDDFTDEEQGDLTSDDFEFYAITNVTDSNGAYLANGVNRYTPNGEIYEETTHIGAGNTEPLRKECTPTFIGSDMEICTLDSTTTAMDITVCIWLEGEDPRCEDYIAGSALDLLLKFKAE